MNLQSFVELLSAHPSVAVQITLPDGSTVPTHFHITEVGRVQKDFVQLRVASVGGQRHESSIGFDQAWQDHRKGNLAVQHDGSPLGSRVRQRRDLSISSAARRRLRRGHRFAAWNQAHGLPGARSLRRATRCRFVLLRARLLLKRGSKPLGTVPVL